MRKRLGEHLGNVNEPYKLMSKLKVYGYCGWIFPETNNVKVKRIIYDFLMRRTLERTYCILRDNLDARKDL